MFLSSSTTYQVCNYPITAALLFKTLMLTLRIHLGKGNVTRANVAEVEINNNASNLLFRDNVTVNTLWSGTIVCKVFILLIMSSLVCH